MSAAQGASPWWLLPNIALLTTAVTILGWFVTSFLAKAREDETKRIEREIKFLERQIGEFYGPFFNLINQVVVMNHVTWNLVNEGTRSGKLTGEDQARIVRYFQERYFFPLHDQINQVLKDKLYLVEGNSLPEDVYIYLRSVAQERAQAELWKELGIDTSFLKGVPYPNDLYRTIKAGMDHAMERYTRYTEILSAQGKNLKKADQLRLVREEEMDERLRMT